jgi:transcriptional regulator with XRE-family HTH domain
MRYIQRMIEPTITRLRDARRDRRISQTDIAALVGTTQSAIARLESGHSDPRLGTLRRYASAVGLRLTLTPSGPSLAATGLSVAAELRRDDPAGALRHVVQFLDDVRRLPAGQMSASLHDEPESVGDQRWDALLAGVAEYAALGVGTAVPGWSAAPGRFLRRFWFVVEDVLGRPAPGLAALAFVGSPAPLANRGVFLDGDALVSG